MPFYLYLSAYSQAECFAFAYAAMGWYLGTLRPKRPKISF